MKMNTTIVVRFNERRLSHAVSIEEGSSYACAFVDAFLGLANWSMSIPNIFGYIGTM